MRRGARLALAAALALPGLGQTRLSLADLEARTPPNYAPAHTGEQVVVRGVAPAPAYRLLDCTLLGIQEGTFGGVLRAPPGDPRLDAFGAGDDLEAEGLVIGLAGMPVVDVQRVTALGRRPPPAPISVSVADLMKFPDNLGYLGRLVRTEGRIVEIGDNTGGAYILLGSTADPYKLFVPRGSSRSDFAGLREGDKIAAAGVALQYCPLGPFNRFFEVIASNSSAIALEETRGIVSPLALGGGLAAALLVCFFLWRHERRLRGQRARLRKMYQLAEEILGAGSVAGILKRVAGSLPSVLGVTRVRLFVHNRAAKTLDEVVEEGAQPVSISLDDPLGGTQGGAVACFHYHTLLAIPDFARSPFPISGERGGAPRSALFVPMLAHSETVGVLELDQHGRAREFTADEQALAQHLGNQIGAAIRLLDQRSVQEQLFRTERLAAVGRLLSGVVDELQTPLASIEELASEASKNPTLETDGRALAAIASEARRASGMVNRLMAFGGGEIANARPVCVSTLLRNLIDFREPDWKASGIHVNDLASREPLYVTGSQGQLEQVFLSLLVHAEQALETAPDKRITIRTSVLGKRLTVEIAFAGPPGPRTPEQTAAALGVSPSILAGHGGEIRLVAKDGEPPRFEVELPLAGDHAPAPGGTRGAPRRLTALLIEPDESAQRHLLGLLAAGGCRVVPVDSADSGLELAHRLRFDLACCSVHAPGLNWVELSERMQPLVRGFVLLSDHYDAELSADFEGDRRFVLAKPFQEEELERVLDQIAHPAGPEGG